MVRAVSIRNGARREARLRLAKERQAEQLQAQHGGTREGAGRPPLRGRVTRCYALTDQHVDQLEQYRQRHQLASASAALRHLIESCQT